MVAEKCQNFNMYLILRFADDTPMYVREKLSNIPEKPATVLEHLLDLVFSDEGGYITEAMLPYSVNQPRASQIGAPLEEAMAALEIHDVKEVKNIIPTIEEQVGIALRAIKIMEAENKIASKLRQYAETMDVEEILAYESADALIDSWRTYMYCIEERGSAM